LLITLITDLDVVNIVTGRTKILEEVLAKFGIIFYEIGKNGI